MNASAVEEKEPKKKPMEEEKSVTYKPLGSTKEVVLKFGFVRRYLCTPTKSGLLPSDEEIVKFLKLCERQALDPWVGDAFLTGYDTYDKNTRTTVAKFSLITAIQALLKRAELSPEFDGLESGVLVIKNDSDEIVERRGTVVLVNESLVGAYSRCWRKDRKHEYFQTVQFETYNTGYSRWEKDPAGMIVKCAKAAVLREAFPTHLAGMYTQEEMDQVVIGEATPHDEHKIIADKHIPAITSKAKTGADLTEILKARNGGQSETVARKQETDSKEMVEPDYEATAESDFFESLMAEMADLRDPHAVEQIEADIQTNEFSDDQKALLLVSLAKVKKKLGI